jgi:uncharacterized protein (DUF433 family)
MARIEIGRYLATDTRVCRGRLIFRGSRILVSDVLELLRTGLTPEQISREYRDVISAEAVCSYKDPAVASSGVKFTRWVDAWQTPTYLCRQNNGFLLLLCTFGLTPHAQRARFRCSG